MKINVIGLGYIGLPTSAMFAKSGNSVLGVDVNDKVVEIINKGQIHIEEPGLAELVNDCVKSGKLMASTKPELADAHIISVPTPNNNDEYKSCDLSYVESAIDSLIPVVKNGDMVIVESTISPRTIDDLVVPIFEKEGYIVGKDIFIAHCPERVLPGQILDELVNNNRIVGGVTPACTEKVAELYSAFVKGEIVKTEAKTAEMSKLMENTFRDVNIALANELTIVCNKLNINVLDVIKMANMHPRVNILSPGPGVGGHCLAIDPYFIYAKAPKEAKIIKLARDINNDMPKFVVENVEKLLNFDKTKKVACLGVTYKANVDDTRESPAMHIVEMLKTKGYDLKVSDPHVKRSDLVTIDEATRDAELVVVLVAHDQFKNLDLETRIFDTVNAVSGETINYGNLHEYVN